MEKMIQHFSLTIYGFDHKTGECNLHIQRHGDTEKEIPAKELMEDIEKVLLKYFDLGTPGTSEL